MNKRYDKLVTQLPGLCVPACIEMILFRHGIESPGQRQLAKYLDFNTSEVNKDFYPEFEYTEDETQQGCKVKDLNVQLFIPLGIPLKEEYYTARHITNLLDMDFDTLPEIIKWLIDGEYDIIASLDHAIISGRSGVVWRHAVLVEDAEGREIQLVTPTESGSIREITDERTMLQSMAVRDGGLWAIKHFQRNGADQSDPN